MLLVNERSLPFAPGLTPAALAARLKPAADLFIVNGFPASPDQTLADGDEVALIRRGEIPDAGEMRHLLHARHTPGVHARIEAATVGIMGLGGLGSMVAVALARIGVGTLILADFDVVEPSNLNRQQYFIDQIGEKKTSALAATLRRVSPCIRVATRDVLLSEENIPEVFAGVQVLAECFDSAPMKAAALRAVRLAMPGVAYVGASGLAGFGDNNTIRTRRLAPRIYLVGDEISAAQPGRGLMAPRVGIAAHQQANQILRLLLGVEDEEEIRS
ncbi:MAG: sulfur carrier protein ThiS adenylyltransferase ThiF [Thermodesulfobacteriota bacterium]